MTYNISMIPVHGCKISETIGHKKRDGNLDGITTKTGEKGHLVWGQNFL